MRLKLQPREQTIAREDRAAPSDGAVLIVEDNRTNALILHAMLQKTGYEAVVAVDGIEGVKMADQLKPRLVLLDLHMPRLDGFAAAAEIQRRAAGHAPVIIAVTANVSPEVHAACLACGFAAVLSKPVFLDTLVATLRRFAPPSAATAG
jgi:two-component system, sensor histidine kinase and response regulator